MMGNVLGGFVTILIAVSLVPEITRRIKSNDWYKTKERPHKQTYREYAEERLSIERMMR